jgi:CRISPR-associated Csx3 family protein
MTGRYLHLKLKLPEHYLDYEAKMNLPLPSISPQRGVVLNGQLPNWLYTGLTLFYHHAAWIAVYSPQLDRAIIVASRAPGTEHAIGKSLAVSDS